MVYHSNKYIAEWSFILIKKYSNLYVYMKITCLYVSWLHLHYQKYYINEFIHIVCVIELSSPRWYTVGSTKWLLYSAVSICMVTRQLRWWPTNIYGDVSTQQYVICTYKLTLWCTNIYGDVSTQQYVTCTYKLTLYYCSLSLTILSQSIRNTFKHKQQTLHTKP